MTNKTTLGAIAFLAATVLAITAGVAVADGDSSTFKVDIVDGENNGLIMTFTALDGEKFNGTYLVTIMELDGRDVLETVPLKSLDGLDMFYIKDSADLNLSKTGSYYVTLTNNKGETSSAIYLGETPSIVLTIDNSEGSGTVYDGNTYQMTVVATPAGLLDWGSAGSCTSFPAGIVQISGTLDSGYTVEALKPGECMITLPITVDGKEYIGEYRLTVEQTDVTSVTVTSENGASIEPGSTLQLSATVTPENATDSKVTWSTSDSNVATVSESGLVTGVSPGSAKITAMAGGVSGSIDITVDSILVESISIGDDFEMSIGGSKQLECTLTPSNATDRNVTWTSSDESVATVSDGKVTAVGKGTATVTATTTNGKTATVTVIVTVVNVTGVSIVEPSSTLKVGDAYKLEYTVQPADASVGSVSWASSNAAVLSVASDGTLTAKAPSDSPVTITVTVVDKYDPEKSFTDSVSISVVSAETPTHTITVVCGNGGTISPNGSALGKVTVLDGSSQTFTITADRGYKVSTVRVDGAEVTLTDGRYTFSNVADDHTIEAEFSYVGTVYPPIDEDDELPILPPVNNNGGNGNGKDDDKTTVVACAAAAVVAVLIAVFLIVEHRKR